MKDARFSLPEIEEGLVRAGLEIIDGLERAHAGRDCDGHRQVRELLAQMARITLRGLCQSTSAAEEERST